jgi:hypothetical protein
VVFVLGIYVGFVVAYVTLYFFGYPLRVLLLNDDLKKFDLYITPWLGIGVIICVLFPLSWLGYSVQSVINYFAAAIATVNVALWARFRETPRAGREDVIALLALGAVTGAVYGVIPALSGFNRFAVTYAGDFGLYLSSSKHVLTSSAKHVAEITSGNLLSDDVAELLHFGLRGCVFIPAFFAALFDIDVARVMYMAYAFVMFLGVAAFRLFLPERRSLFALLPLLCALLLNTFYQRLVFMAFFGQLFSFGLVPLAFFLETRLARAGKFEPRTCLLLVFVLTVNGLSYLHGLAYPLIPALALPFALALDKKIDRKSCVQNAALAGVLYTLVNAPMIAEFVRIFLSIDAGATVWPMHFTTMMDIAGIQRAFSPGEAMFWALVASNAVMISVVIAQLFREGPPSFTSLCFAAYALTHAFFCVRYFKFGEAASYNAFKSALSMSFIVIILVLRFLGEQLDNFRRGVLEYVHERKKFPAAGALCCALFAVALALNVLATVNNLGWLASIQDGGLTRSNEAVGFFAESPSYAKSDFIINSDKQLLQFSTVCYAPLGRAYTNGYGGNENDSQRVMKDSISAGDIYISESALENYFSSVNERSVFENDIYRIFRLDEDSVILSAYSGMSRVPRTLVTPEGRVLGRRVTSGAAEMEFLSVSDRDAGIAMTFFDGNAGASPAGVFVNGAFAGEFHGDGEYLRLSFEGLPFKKGKNFIKIEFSGDISKLSLTRLEISR